MWLREMISFAWWSRRWVRRNLHKILCLCGLHVWWSNPSISSRSQMRQRNYKFQPSRRNERTNSGDCFAPCNGTFLRCIEPLLGTNRCCKEENPRSPTPSLHSWRALLIKVHPYMTFSCKPGHLLCDPIGWRLCFTEPATRTFGTCGGNQVWKWGWTCVTLGWTVRSREIKLLQINWTWDIATNLTLLSQRFFCPSFLVLCLGFTYGTGRVQSWSGQWPYATDPYLLWHCDLVAVTCLSCLFAKTVSSFGLTPKTTKVIARKNLGDHLNSTWPEPERFNEAQGEILSSMKNMWFMCSLKAIDFYVNDRFPTPCGKAHLTTIPNASLEEFWLGLQHFDYTPNGRNGCGGLFKDFVLGVC